jgi:hypothetical protein
MGPGGEASSRQEMHTRDLKALLVYLKENSPRYPLESLREQMVKAGHPPADADRAVAVFQGRAPLPEPVWAPALLVALADFALAGLSVALFSRYGMGEAACSSLVLVPAVYLIELFGGLIFFASGKDRWGRALLLGFLLFVLMGLLVLLGLLIRWVSKVAGS